MFDLKKDIVVYESRKYDDNISGVKELFKNSDFNSYEIKLYKRSVSNYHTFLNCYIKGWGLFLDKVRYFVMGLLLERVLFFLILLIIKFFDINYLKNTFKKNNVISNIFFNRVFSLEVFNKALNQEMHKQTPSIILSITNNKVTNLYKLKRESESAFFSVVSQFSLNPLTDIGDSPFKKLAIVSKFPFEVFFFNIQIDRQNCEVLKEDFSVSLLINETVIDENCEEIKPKNVMKKYLFDSHSSFNSERQLNPELINYIFYGKSDYGLSVKESLNTDDFGLRKTDQVEEIFRLIQEIVYLLGFKKSSIFDYYYPEFFTRFVNFTKVDKIVNMYHRYRTVNICIKCIDKIDNLFDKGEKGKPNRILSKKEFIKKIYFSNKKMHSGNFF